MPESPIFETAPLPPGPWPTLDPFLFCAHHNDAYPAGDGKLAPKASLADRPIGQDFSGKDGWSMYHGDSVPGFPQHPHRGFETVTVARKGYIDHSDSLGAAARFGDGDLQWMTAGAGVVHSEMFPLIETDAGNPTELFQIWLNLPKAEKMAPPHFAMFWSGDIPRLETTDADGNAVTVVSYAGALPGGGAPPAPPPHSWAAKPEAEVAIWTIRLDPGARWTIPAAKPGLNRLIYLFTEAPAEIAGQPLGARHVARAVSDVDVEVAAGVAGAEFLLLEGRPIGEPVAQHGPFVMNSQQELQQAFEDYRRTQFGGWPWGSADPTHGQAAERFARLPDGTELRPDG